MTSSIDKLCVCDRAAGAIKIEFAEFGTIYEDESTVWTSSGLLESQTVWTVVDPDWRRLGGWSSLHSNAATFILSGLSCLVVRWRGRAILFRLAFALCRRYVRKRALLDSNIVMSTVNDGLLWRR